MKILSRKNGIALVAVLAVLLVLTLLLPVMFRNSQTATASAAVSAQKQKAQYLARSGVEMAISALKVTLEYEETQTSDPNYLFHKALKKANEDKSVNEENNPYNLRMVTKNDVLMPQFDVQRIWFFQSTDFDSKAAVPNPEHSKYFCGEEEDIPDVLNDTDLYTRVGYVDVTITYDADPKYYKDATTGQPTLLKPSEVNSSVVDPTTGEIKDGYSVIRNTSYIIEGTANIGGVNQKKEAVVVETYDVCKGESDKKPVEFTGYKWSEAPNFVRRMNDHPTDSMPLNDDGDPHDPTYDHGGNQCMVNPSLANMKKKIEYDNPIYNTNGGYTPQSVYIYTTLGNMLLKNDGAAPNGQKYVFGLFPGFRWDSPNDPGCNCIVGINYDDYSDVAQNANFVSLCATNAIQFDMGIDLRVSPCRAGRVGDIGLLEGITGGSYNASLYKVLTLQAKEIVINEDVQMFISFFQPKNHREYKRVPKQDKNVGKRMGTLVLTAPTDTPYTYYNDERGENVPAGKVFFTKDVYIWFIKYGNDGSGLSTETVYYTGNFSSNSFPKKANKEADGTEIGVGDYQIVKLFDAGDVYYFNAGIEVEQDNGKKEKVGVSLVNWWVETQYLKRKNLEDSSSVSDFFKTIRKNLYVSLMESFSNTDTYVKDDMKYIGNIYDDPTLLTPEVDDELYVVWSN